MTDSTVCPVNINAAGRRRRMVLGIVGLVAALVLHFAFPHEPASWHAIVGILLLVYGWLCVMQAVANTCVVLAAKGAREADGGVEQVGDATISAALRKRAVTVYVRTAIAVVVTIAALGALRHFTGL